MRVLLTGAAGFIGSHLAESLLERGDEVVGVDNFDPFYDRALKERNVAELARWPGWFLETGDIRDRALVERLLQPGEFDALVHLAARAGVRPSIEDPETYVDVNLRGTVILLEAARRAGVRRIVAASSSSVYGADTQAPFSTEARADSPVSPYAATKRAGELLCEAFASLHALSVVSLRYFTVFGPRQRPDMAISRFIRQLEAGRPIRRHGDGSSRRDYTYVADAVAGTVAALDLTGNGWTGHRVYNLGGARATTLADLIAAIERATGRDAVIEELPEQAGDVPLTLADLEASRRDLGYEPEVDLELGLHQQVLWHRSLSAQMPRRRQDESTAAEAP